MDLRSRTRSARIAGSAATALALLAVVACGDDDDGTVAERAVAPGEEASGAPSDCAGTDLTFTNLETGVSGTATSALAERLVDGGLYTVHAADFAIDEDALESWRPEVPEGNNVITVQLTVFNATEPPEPVEVGATLDATGDFGVLTFVTRHFTATEDWSQTDLLATEDLPKRLTVTGVGDTFCFEIDFADQQKEISGTVEAPVFRG